MNLGLPDNSKIIIYYSAGEIFLGVAIVIIAFFFAYDYYFTHVVENCEVTPSTYRL